MHSKSLAILFALFGVDASMIIVTASLEVTVKDTVTIRVGDRVYRLNKEVGI